LGLGNQLSVKIQESLAAAKIILGFGVQNKVVTSLTLLNQKLIRVGLKQMTLKQVVTSATHPISILVVIIAFTLSRKFSITVADTAVMLYAFMSVVPLISGITSQRHVIEEYVPSYQQYIDKINRANDLKQVSGSKKFNSIESDIVVENISFAYPKNELTLTDISMLIPKGKMIAIVGESGAGKSTLIDVLMGFNEPTNGTVYIDGVPLQDYDIQTYRNKIGYVPQESVLFNMSIADNLRWAKDDTTDEEIKEACQLAYADGFIESLPDKYDTLVGDRGVRLSGGQAQRVCLARAIIRDPELLFLDEATSALDTESEGMIQKAIDNLSGEITIVVIAHRFSTIRKADYVYVLEKGIVIEEGSYKDLTRKTDTRLRKMVAKQKL
jgi:ABC-type multidrug transport system fused ATPase/permease subunit